MRAVIYTRVSLDKRQGRSVAEQADLCRKTCEQNQWDIVQVNGTDYVCDNSIGASGYSKKTRDGWAKVHSLIASGACDVLVVWKASRASRDMEAYLELERVCQQYDVLYCSEGTVLDLSKGSDRFRGGLDALLSRRDADEISENVRRAMKASADKGRPHGRVGYGFKRIYDEQTGQSRQVPDPVEAEVVRHIFTRYLSGVGMQKIAKELNAAGTLRRTGAQWQDVQVRRILTSLTVAGKRLYRGEVVGEGDWEPLVSAEVFDQAQVRLAAMSERRSHQVAGSNLLTSIARCGVCNSRMRVLRDRDTRRFYECKGGYHVTRDLAHLDGYVTAVVLERLKSPDVQDADTAPDPEAQAARIEADRLKAELEEALALWEQGQLSITAYSRMEQTLTTRIKEAEHTARSTVMPLAFDLPTADHVAAWWERLSPELRREVVGAVVRYVRVMPVGQGKRTFDPTAIDVVWR